jgi:hypothetical protein
MKMKNRLTFMIIVAVCTALFGFGDKGPTKSQDININKGLTVITPVQSNCYFPVDGGWRIILKGNKNSSISKSSSCMGVPHDDARLHRRPLYPPADRTMIWNKNELSLLDRCSFRPLVLAYNEPRFLFDFHSAGGLLGHLFIGLSGKGGSKWFHKWSDLDVSYVDGLMNYVVCDSTFPGVAVSLSAAPLASSAGLIVRVTVKGGEGLQLVWAYGGASAFFTCYSMNAPQFNYEPGQCINDRVTWSDRHFSLHRAFNESDEYMKELISAARYLPGWEATIQGGSSWDGQIGFGSPYEFAISPKSLCDSSRWVNLPEEQRNCVAVQVAQLGQDTNHGYIVIGMGGNIRQALENPEEVWHAVGVRNHTIEGRIITRTPDPYLDAAMRMMAFSTEGTWGDLSILHGAWSWRRAYLGWRGWYGSNCYGWTDRVRKSIENQIRLGLVSEGVDSGALGSILDSSKPGVYYNMNEVFMDQVRQYFDYTNDIDLMERIFPVLEGICKWEDRRLEPNGEFLYENSLNTWISDSHWYIGGQCTQASAYMLRANTFLADLAERLGKDPVPYSERAGKIRAAMQEKLWMDNEGVFAEYLDTRGNRMLHPNPELPTIYHSAEFGAANVKQVAQMLTWADRHLKKEQTPGGGELFWSSNWAPNRGRSYTHSTYEMAYAEELNLALTNYLAGRADEAYKLIRGNLCGIFNGPTPGGLACHAYVDGRQRANDEFADAISMWARTVSEGLFGIIPRRPEGRIILCPQFPRDWRHAEITTPAFSYQWNKDDHGVNIEWSSPVETAVSLRMPIRAGKIRKVLINGSPVEATIEKGFAGINWVLLSTPQGNAGRIVVRFKETGVTTFSPKETPRLTGNEVRRWSPPLMKSKEPMMWTLINLDTIFNTSVTEVLQQVAEAAVPPLSPASQVGFNYWRNYHMGSPGFNQSKSYNQAISDSAWRSKVDENGTAWTTDGIPFKSRKQGYNIAVVTLAGGFPHGITFPVDAKGTTLYLMLSGITFPVQSHIVNLRVTLCYNDGSIQQTDLFNPQDIGDCWSTWCGRFHDTPANGFENIGGRTGSKGSGEVEDLSKPVATDTEAHLVSFPLTANVKLASVRVEAVANDIIFGVMGATILK